MSKDYKKRLKELEKEWLYPDNSNAVQELWSIVHSLLKERDDLLKEELCDRCNKPIEVHYGLCGECFYDSGGY